MKKNKIIFILTLAFSIGCSPVSTNVSSDKSSLSQTGSYEEYESAVSKETDLTSYGVAVHSSYDMSYSDDTKDIYELDGVLEVQDVDTNPVAKLAQNIQSNGGNFLIQGHYHDGRLYNSYNDITYYEDMKFDELKQVMIVPLKPTVFPKSMIESMNVSNNDDGLKYSISLNTSDAKEIFEDRYDSYGFQSFDSYQIVENEIQDHFDDDGHFIGETADFTITVKVQDQEVTVKYQSSVEYMNLNDTVVKIDNQSLEDEKSYVAFDQIDTSEIGDSLVDDTAEKSAIDTFKKRLVNRLGYEISEEGYYQMDYNDSESYVIDFGSDSFVYSNYSIRYVYNWKGDIGSLGACTIDFKDDRIASSCEDDTVDMIRKVKNYFRMELYYCGLSLEDLQADTK